ncbi:hypothetical protein [Nocardioides mangrovi]|uniref:CpsD/CapB family tyrosine-protein kinase n=1 Tax=Nocardioides mangrovi TaxID=2874580 RepID=A0ABS7UC81_9ACTN|nr:hypothetical protein [Nocardioides mangrovi]MBZ5738487.1 hypothetical protein [Nocardioides mangrovi]
MLATHGDGALLVVRYGSTTRDQLAQAADRLAQVGSAPVGVVLNMVPNQRRSHGYGYAPTPEANGADGKQVRKRKR